MATSFPVVSLTGPRQSGKTTLLRSVFKDHIYLSLENLDIRAEAESDPRGFLRRCASGVILDEVQRVPELFSYLQGVVDERDVMGKFVLSGSQNFLLMESISQSLAGRVAVLHLYPFSIGELPPTPKQSLDRRLLEAGFIAMRLQPYTHNWNKRLVKQPKLIFLDSGVLCSLLGIRTEQELQTHPLRGSIFESWVISEAVKAARHQGVRPAIYFWRDHTGHEIDLVMEEAGKLRAVEIKSGETVLPSWLDGMNWFRKVAGTDLISSEIIYGGDRDSVRDEIEISSWRNIF